VAQIRADGTMGTWAAVTPLPIRAAEAILNRGLGKVVELAGGKVDPD